MGTILTHTLGQTACIPVCTDILPTLPVEVWCRILEFLGKGDVLSVRLCSNYLRNICEDLFVSFLPTDQFALWKRINLTIGSGQMSDLVFFLGHIQPQAHRCKEMPYEEVHIFHCNILVNALICEQYDMADLIYHYVNISYSGTDRLVTQKLINTSFYELCQYNRVDMMEWFMPWARPVLENWFARNKRQIEDELQSHACYDSLKYTRQNFRTTGLSPFMDNSLECAR